MRCSLAPALVFAASIANAVPAAVRMILRIAGHRTCRQRCSPRAFPALGGCGGDMCKRDSESQSAGPHNFEEDERQNSAISIETANDIIAAVLSAPGRRNPGPERSKRASCPVIWGKPSIFIGFFLQMIASQQQRTYLKAYRA